MVGDLEPRAHALVRADLQPHVVRVLDGGEVEVAAPDEGRQILQKPRARRQIARRRARLDIGRALPRPADALVIGLGGVHAQADGGGAGVGPQPQVGAKDIALRRDLGNQLDDAPHRLHHPRLDLRQIAAFPARVVEQADQVDVGGIVQLARALLAHGDDHEAGPARVHALERAGGLRRQRRVRRHLQRAVGEVAQAPRHRVQPPDPAQIGQRDQQRGAPLGQPQGGADRLQPRVRLRRRQNIGQRRLRRLRRRLRQPVALAVDQTGEIGAGPRRPGDQRAQPCVEARRRRRADLGVQGARRRRQARDQAVSGLQNAPRACRGTPSPLPENRATRPPALAVSPPAPVARPDRSPHSPAAPAW